MKTLLIAAILLCATAAVMAQFKVVAPDGTVTYTDRPSAPPGSKVVQVGRESAAAASPQIALPYDLRQIVDRFPVTLYTTGDCAPCDNGRRLLQQRGIPYAERSVQSDEDQAVLQQLSGARTVPVLAVGGQLSRGWLESEWQANLDLAGYPQQSRLPRDWQPPPVTPLAPRAEAAPRTAAAPPPPPPPEAAPQQQPDAPPALKF